jgi:hypothetical protein
MSREFDIGSYVPEGELLGTEGTLLDILNALGSGLGFPVATTATNTSVTVGNTSTAVLALNTARKILILVNASDEAIYLSLSATAVQGDGIYLSPSGGALTLDLQGMYTGVISAICASGGKELTVMEAT